MNRPAAALPQLEGGWFLTDAGLETVLIFQEGVSLPEFAAFVLLDSRDGRERLRSYFRRFLDIAAQTPDAGFVLESPTWRAGIDWGAKLGFDAAMMQRLNRDAIALMQELAAEYGARVAKPIVVSGCIGPRGDGYVAGAPMALDDAQRAHQPQVEDHDHRDQLGHEPFAQRDGHGREHFAPTAAPRPRKQLHQSVVICVGVSSDVDRQHEDEDQPRDDRDRR